MAWETNEGYEPQSLEDDIFLSDIPVPLTLENLKSQFENPIDNKNDYISVFIDDYIYSREQCVDEDELAQLRDIRNGFYVEVMKMFKKYLNIGLPDFEDKSEDEQDLLIKGVYRYFIINIKRNFNQYIMNYIEENKKELLSICERKKDITTLAYKKELDDPEYLAIIANIHDVITTALEDDVDVEDFLRLSDKHHEWENSFINASYDDCSITGNFVDKYKAIIANNEEYRSDLDVKIRNKIFKKVRNSK